MTNEIINANESSVSFVPWGCIKYRELLEGQAGKTVEVFSFIFLSKLHHSRM